MPVPHAAGSSHHPISTLLGASSTASGRAKLRPTNPSHSPVWRSRADLQPNPYRDQWPSASAKRASLRSRLQAQPSPNSPVTRGSAASRTKSSSRSSSHCSSSSRSVSSVAAPCVGAFTLLREIDRPALPDHRDLDLARVLELLLEVTRDPVREERGGVVVHLLGLDDYADLAARLHRVDLLDAGMPGRDLLELAEALGVLLERLAARSRPGARERIHDLHDHGLDCLQLNFVVMGLHRVRDGLGLAVAPGELAADQRVRALDLVRHRLADVVHQRGARGGLGPRAQLGGEERRKPRALDRVGEHVLAIARPVVQPAEQLRELRVDRPDVRLEHRLLTDLSDPVLDLRPRLVVGLLDARRMDPAVLQERLERQPSDLATDAVESGQNHRTRRVVDDEVDAGEGLERADVASLAADDPALQVVRVERHRGHGRLGGMAAGDTLLLRRQDAARLPVGVTAGRLVDLADERRAVVAKLLLELAQEDLTSLNRAQAGDPLKLGDVLLLGGLELAQLVVEVPLPALEGRLAALDLADAHVEGLLLAQQPLLDTGDL